MKAALLKKFGVSVPESVMEMMDTAPDEWESVKNRMFVVKESLNDQYNRRVQPQYISPNHNCNPNTNPGREGDKIKSQALKFTKEANSS